MSKKKRHQYGRQYMRLTEGYQRNIARSKMNELGVKPPSEKHFTKIFTISKILFVVWIIVTIIVTYKFLFPGLLSCGLVAVLYVLILFKYVEHYQIQLVEAYMDMDIPKDIYISEISKRRNNPKAINKLSKIWDKVEKKRERKAAKTASTQP